MQNEDYDVDEIWKNLDKKKKVNGNKKGKRGERNIVKIFNDRFSKLLSSDKSLGLFSRSLGSGNRTQQVSLSSSMTTALSGDLTCPNIFNFSIESKHGMTDIDLVSAFENGNKKIDSFLTQALKNSERAKKQPLLIWKKDYQPALAFIIDTSNSLNCPYQMKYREWTVVSLDELLKLPDEFFFET